MYFHALFLLLCGGQTGQTAGRPRDLQIKAAGVGVDVEHLAREVQAAAVFFDSMVLGLTSRTDTPPVVTMASAIGRLPEISTGKHLSTRSSEARCFFRDGIQPFFARVDAALFDDRRDEFFRGSSSPRAFTKSLFLCLSKSASRRLSSVFSIERRLEVDLDTVAFGCRNGAYVRSRTARADPTDRSA